VAQFARKSTRSKGPRALALLELFPSGKTRLIPVAIMDDGKFYDASAYKASPVPMALEAGTVYEGLRTGASQGLFTVSSALQLKNTWLGQGTWHPAGEAPAKKAVLTTKPAQEDTEGPPRLRRSPEKPATPELASPQPPAPAAQPIPPAAAPTAAPPSVATPSTPVEEDSDRPLLRRGKQTNPPEPAQAKPGSTPKAAAKPTANAPQVFPAISDAGGPDPMPFTYDLKPDEEQAFRTKMLALAATELQARAKQLASETISPTPPAKGSKAAKPAQPNFDDVQLRVFDLASNNEPVLVLTAKVHMPQRPTAAASLQNLVTLVAREDIYGELHKVLANITDTQHLDVTPRLELIDAVDADGDGRGDLLFRESSDAGSAFVIDRVVGDQVYTLFEGTPE